MITLYGIPNCDTVKKARTWLEQRSLEYSFHDVRKDGLSTYCIEEWCQRVDWEILVNKRSTTWKQLDDSARNSLNRTNVAELLQQHPTLIKRPVLDTGESLQVGFNATNYESIF